MNKVHSFISACILVAACCLPVIPKASPALPTDGEITQQRGSVASGITSALERIASQQEKQTALREEEKSDDRPVRDLAAQEAMARWAEWSLIVAAVGAMISGFGLIALLLSLRLTRQSVAASLDAVQVARDSVALQNRAWLSLKCELLNAQTMLIGRDPAIFFKLKFTVANNGNSPATNIVIEEMIQEARQYNDPEPDFAVMMKWAAACEAPQPGLIDDRPKFVLFPGETMVRGSTLFLKHKHMKEAAADRGFSQPTVFVRVSYDARNVETRRQTMYFSEVVTVVEGQLHPLMAGEPIFFDKLPDQLFLSPHATAFAD